MTETVEVLAVFSKNGDPKPRAFKYAGRLIQIEKINLCYISKEGAHKIIIFEISGNKSSQTLIFHTGTLQWQIKNYFYS